LVRAQHGEPKKEASAEMQGLPSFVPCGFLADGPVFRQTHPAVNGLRRCRRLRREKAVPELEETGSGAPATRAARDHGSDRRGRWFEPNTGSQKRGSARKRGPSLLAVRRAWPTALCFGGRIRLLTGSGAAAACGGKRQCLSWKKQGAGRPLRGRPATMFLTGGVVGSSPTRGANCGYPSIIWMGDRARPCPGLEGL
jgi:hypothetical protein